MTEQDKITIFDALIKTFLCSDALSIDHEGDNLFSQAIRLLHNSSLLAQQDNHLGCERYERLTARNAQRNGFKPRPIPPIAHLFLDATYTKVRMHDIVSDCAVFVAVGIDAETGRRMVLGVSVGLSEAAEHSATFIQSLMMRGMNRPNCITCDDHKGIRKALAETLTGVP